MKIYEIGTGYTPIPAQVAAATESVVEELTKAFLDMGQDVEILDISAQNRAAHNLPIMEVKVPSVFSRSDVSLGIVHKVKRVAYSVALAGKLKKLLRNTDEKVVLHFHNQYNMFFFLKLVPKNLRCKALVAYTNHNGLWSLPWDEVAEPIRKRYFQETESMRNADLVFVLNHKMKENVVAHLGIPEKRVIHIDNGVNVDVYRPISVEEIQRTKKELSLEGKRVILQVGSINENKGQARSLHALAPLLKERKDMVFAYAGGVVSAEYHQEVQHLAEELGVTDQVRYLGMFPPGEEMNRIYNIADATIFSSRYESFGLVCIESIAAGVPVILRTQIPLEFGPGCIKLQGECDRETIEQFLENIMSLKELARCNAVKNYTWASIARRYINAMQMTVETGEM